MQEVVIEIDERGDVQIEVSGVNGKACTELTRELETDLGLSVTARRLKPEYHRSMAQQREAKR